MVDTCSVQLGENQNKMFYGWKDPVGVWHGVCITPLQHLAVFRKHITPGTSVFRWRSAHSHQYWLLSDSPDETDPHWVCVTFPSWCIAVWCQLLIFANYKELLCFETFFIVKFNWNVSESSKAGKGTKQVEGMTVETSLWTKVKEIKQDAVFCKCYYWQQLIATEHAIAFIDRLFFSFSNWYVVCKWNVMFSFSTNHLNTFKPFKQFKTDRLGSVEAHSFLISIKNRNIIAISLMAVAC